MKSTPTHNDALDRRSFLKGMAALAILGPSIAGCASRVPLQVPGFKGLAQLPYFEVGKDGHLRCTVKDLPPIIDFHAHLGLSFMSAPEIDYLKETSRTRYMFDLDESRPPDTLDLDRYINRSPGPETVKRAEAAVASSLKKGGSPVSKTHTIPNLIREMDAMGVQRAVLQSITLHAPLRDNIPYQWHRAIRKSGYADRFVLYGTADPKDRATIRKLRWQKKALGIRGIKVHPTAGRFFPSSDKAMEIYAECEKLSLPVFWHTGSQDINDNPIYQYTNMKHYIEPVRSFPKVRFIFGHSGNRQWRQAIPIAKENENVWLETHGQGVTAMRAFLAELGPERLFFGSDWPWYAIAASIAKVLIVTKGDKKVRNMIFTENADRFLRG